VTPPHPNAILNPERPSNPFSATNQPDWAERPPPMPVRRTPRGDTRQQSIGTDSRGAPGRMLPPPFDGPRIGSELPSRPREASIASPRRDGASGRHSPTPSTLSHQPSGSRKPGPPVPKKPDLLSSKSTLDIEAGANVEGQPNTAGARGLQSDSPRETGNGRMQTPIPKPLPPPARRITGSRLADTQGSSPARDSSTPPPAVRPRNPAAQRRNSSVGPPLPPRRPTDLMDRDDERTPEMASWKPLQPQ
jgi:hypothetical protein